MSDLEDETAAISDRRKFLTACGKFAGITPPAITVLLSTSLNSTAIAHSVGRDARGWGIMIGANVTTSTITVIATEARA